MLSRHLKAMEAETGLELYDRTVTPMRLTAVGELFLPIATEVANANERVKAFCARYRKTSVETVRIRGVVDAATMPFLRDAKTRFEAANPDERVKFMRQQFQTPFSDIREGRLDIAIEPLSSLIETHDLAWLHVAHERSSVIVEASHPIAGRASLTMDDLGNLRFTSLRSNVDNAMRKHLQELCKQLGLLGDISKNLMPSATETYDDLLLEGLGECALMLPEGIAQRCVSDYSDQYVAIPFGEGEADYDLCAFYREDAPAYVHRYLDALREVTAASIS